MFNSCLIRSLRLSGTYRKAKSSSATAILQILKLLNCCGIYFKYVPSWATAILPSSS